MILVCTVFLALLSFTGCDGEEIEFYVVDSDTSNNQDLLEIEKITQVVSNEAIENVEEVAEELNEETEEVDETDDDSESKKYFDFDEVEDTDEAEDVDVADNVDDVEKVDDVDVVDDVVEEQVDVSDKIETTAIEVTATQTSSVIVAGDTLVAQSEAVSNEYFADALFIGDSLLKGYKAFVSPYPNNVIADQNAGLDQIFANKSIYYTSPTVQTNLWDAIDQVMPTPEKIYVLIGVNGIPGLENSQSMGYYTDLINKLKARFPNKTFYICAVTPLTKELSDKRAPSLCTEKIDDFNDQLFTLCEEQGVFFLQTDEWLKTPLGYLNYEYDGGDGLHLNKAGHTVLLDYFKTHTVSTASVIEETVEETV